MRSSRCCWARWRFCSGSWTASSCPPSTAPPRYLVRRDSITRVVAAKTIVARGAEFAGAPLGSWLLVVASAAVAFWVNAWLFAVSVVLLAMTRMAIPSEDGLGQDLPDAEPSPKQPALSVWADLRAGIRLIRGYRTLTTLLIVVFVVELGFSGPMIAGVPLLANETGWGVRTVGWVLGGFGFGAAAGAGFLLWRKTVRHTGIVALFGLTAMGLSVVGLGLLPGLGLPVSASLVAAGLISASAPASAPVSMARSSPLLCCSWLRPVKSAESWVPVLLKPGRGSHHLRPHRALTEVSNAQVPFLIGGS